MKKCVNCKSDIRDTDKYCRNCGFYVCKNSYYILVNIAIIIVAAGILFMLAIFIASYFVY